MAPTADETEILIVGAGIGGLVTALSLHAIGQTVRVFESTEEIRALGAGINLLPHAVRELDALGLLDTLAAEAVAANSLMYFSKHGALIWSEARGLAGGYQWPQLSIHRSTLQRTLLAAVTDRIGADRLHTGHTLTSVVTHQDTVIAQFDDRRSGASIEARGVALIAADGIHSAARRQFFPHEGPPRWNGALLWRGVAECDPVLDGRTMVWAGHPRQKFVGYPIADLPGGRQQFNFIAELRTDETELAEREDWNRPGNLEDFLPQFESWVFDWLNVPELVRQSSGTLLFPMIDRDPLHQWTYGRVTLLGDAAHPMYPIGSNGASQAILDARVLAGCLRTHTDVEDALAMYESVRRPATSAIVLANRGNGPEVPMQLVEERAPHGFSNIADVISPDEILHITDGYRRTAGFALDALHNAESLADQNY